MDKTKRLVIVVLFIFCLSLFSEEVLSLDRAIELAKRNNPEIKTAYNDLKSAEKSWQSSYLGMVPSANLNYNKLFLNPGSNTSAGKLEANSSFGITATQPIFNGGKIYLSAGISGNLHKIQQENYRSKMLEIAALTESKYFLVQSYNAMVKVLEKKFMQNAINMEIAETRFNSGLISETDYLQIRSEKLSSELELINMHNSFELSKLDLADHIGYRTDFSCEEFYLKPYEGLLGILSRNDTKYLALLEEKLIEIGRTKNPALNISKLSINNSQKSRKMAAGNILPSLNISYTYNWENSNIAKDFSGSSTFAIIAAMPVFPVADNVLDYEAARYELMSAERSYDSTLNSITLIIRTNCLSLFNKARAVESAELNRDLARETWGKMQIRFEKGLISVSDLISVEVMLLNSENYFITSQQEFLKAISNLNQVLGLEDKNELFNIINGLEEK
jgi:outer membrane protein